MWRAGAGLPDFISGFRCEQGIERDHLARILEIGSIAGIEVRFARSAAREDHVVLREFDMKVSDLSYKFAGDRGAVQQAGSRNKGAFEIYGVLGAKQKVDVGDVVGQRVGTNADRRGRRLAAAVYPALADPLDANRAAERGND